MNKDSVDEYERCEYELGLGYERKIGEGPVYVNLLPLRMFRWSDESVNGVLAGYHGVPNMLSRLCC